MGSASATLAHPAFLYDDTDGYLAGTVDFVQGGLAAGEPVAVAVPAPRLGQLAAALGADAGRITMIDMSEAGRNPGRIIPTVLLAFLDAHPGRRTRIIGEPVWPGRSELEYPACVQHEALINVALADRPTTVLCPYDRNGLSEDILADAAATHPTIRGHDGEQASPRYGPTGILDTYNAPIPADRPSATSFIFSAATVAEARRYAVSRAGRAGLAPGRAGDAELIVSELATNSVRHGGGAGTLRIWTADGLFVCEVRDTGRIRDPLVGRRTVSPTDPGGRGLLLVNRLADLVRVHTGDAGTTIRAYLRLP